MDLLEEICRVGASLYARGYAHGTAGNISARSTSGFVITPTDASLGQLDPTRLAIVDHAGNQTGGDRASKTLILHRRIYAADPDAHCVIHTHATHAVALTLAGVWNIDDVMPPITAYQLMKVGHVPLIGYHRPGDPSVGDQVAARITAMRNRRVPIRAVLLDRLGPTVWHRTPAEASAVLEELEETARLWLMTKPAPLSNDRIDELRRHFDVKW